MKELRTAFDRVFQELVDHRFVQFDEHMLEAMWHQFVSDMQRGFAHWLAQGEHNTRPLSLGTMWERDEETSGPLVAARREREQASILAH